MRSFKVFAASLMLMASQLLVAQITITKTDMPSINDTVRLSVKTSLTNFQPDSTGANYMWDYSTLVPDSQRKWKCVSPATTSYSVPYAFVPGCYGVYNYNPDQFPYSLAGSPPTNVYDFYVKNTNYLAIVGQGMTLGGQPVPAVYSNGTGDYVYRFPMNYLNKDSSTCYFGAPIPGFGYYRKTQTRHNEVDGWGTLITPFGTFNTLRVKSTIDITDSIYLDTLGFGLNIPRQTIVEYKWLANGKKIPVLEVDVTLGFFGGFTVDRVNWQDVYLAPIGITFTNVNSCPIVNEGSASATVTGGKPPYSYAWSTGDTTTSIDTLAPGVYTLTVTDTYGWSATATDTIQALNDSSCMILASFSSTRTCAKASDGALTATVTGARLPAKYKWNTGDTTLTISNLPIGTYTLYITDRFDRKDTAITTVEALVGDSKCLNIPTGFTPDGDGTNDTWNIRSLSEFPNCNVEVFNQWGSLIFKSGRYATPWDGKYNGEPSPPGAYYFVIDLGNGEPRYTGTVTIIR